MVVLWLCLALHGVVAQVDRPHIILFVSDNVMWNNAGFRNSDQLTPNLDALAHSGLKLENHYASPICAPSRSALMTGIHPAYTGMHRDVEISDLPRTSKLLPEHLSDLGYDAHIIGKWRLGSFMREQLHQGFENELSSWTGKGNTFHDIHTDKGSCGYDRTDDLNEKYATDVYTAEAVKRIKSHDKNKPMFLMVVNYVDLNDVIGQGHNYSAIMSELDRSVGEVFSALHDYELLSNSIILFSTDNGGPAAGFNDNAASNHPLSDVKNTLWEGGVRGSAVLWSPLIEKKTSVATQRIHNADWLPTLISAAGGDISALGNIDGINQWEVLTKDQQSTGLDDNGIRNILPSNNEMLELRETANSKYNRSMETVNYEPITQSCLYAEDRIPMNAGIWLSGSHQFY